IYVTKYAAKNRFNDLEAGSDCVVLDLGINSGVLRADWFAQAITGRPKANVFNDDLVKAANDMDADTFIDRMGDRRLAFLRGLSTWPRFKGGWSTPCQDLRHYSHAIAGGSKPPE